MTIIEFFNTFKLDENVWKILLSILLMVYIARAAK